MLFGNDNFWLSSGPASCGKSCFSEPKGEDAWNHGTMAEQIHTTWVGLVGPGVARHGIDNSVWSVGFPSYRGDIALREVGDGRVTAEVRS